MSPKNDGNKDGHLDQLSGSALYEVESLRASKKQAEIKLELLKNRYEQELATFNQTRVENIFKNSGAREFMERIKNLTRIKDDTIRSLKEDLEYKSNEVAELQDRCKEAEKLSQEYWKAWKNAEFSRNKLKIDNNSRSSSKDNQIFKNLSTLNTSSPSSVIESNSVPPPPPVDVPSMEEIFSMTPFAGEQSYSGLNSSIPPPPDVEVPLEEILTSDDRKACEQERGQFMCRLYLSIDSDSSQETLSEIVQLVQAEKDRSSSKAFHGWVSLNNQTDALEKSDFHVTLLRGHRTIHYHQIKPLVAAIRDLCKNFKRTNLCLDMLRLFGNHQGTKQFLALSTRNNQESIELSALKTLKQALRDAVDQFADRLTQEDETEDTLPHCSIMFREVSEVYDENQVQNDLKEIVDLCNEKLEEYICLVNVDTIYLKIGKEVYSFRL